MVRSALIALAIALPLLIGIPVLANNVELGDVAIAFLFVVAVTVPTIVAIRLEERRRRQPPVTQR